MHIRRAFIQTYKWLTAPFFPQCDLDPLHYGYEIENDVLIPKISNDIPIPSDFPLPCNCLKCARANVCPCRIKNISCCEFCKCKNNCNNPV